MVRSRLARLPDPPSPRKAIGMTPTERFWTKVEKRGSYECWPWLGSLTYKGYGQFMLTRRQMVPAHRFAYESMIGPIPDDLTIDHLCRNKPCCNPIHMQPVTRGENARRGNLGLRRTVCYHGHPMTPENTVYWGTNRHGRPDRRCRTCALEKSRRNQSRRVEANRLRAERIRNGA